MTHKSYSFSICPTDVSAFKFFICSVVLLGFGGVLRAQPSDTDEAQGSSFEMYQKSSVLFQFRLYDPDGCPVDDALVLATSTRASHVPLHSAKGFEGMQVCRYDTIYQRYTVTATSPLRERIPGYPGTHITLSIIHTQYGNQKRVLSDFCKWPVVYAPSYGNSFPDVDIHITYRGDEIYGDGCRSMPYTPLPAVICVVTNDSDLDRERLRLRLFDSLGLVDIGQHPMNTLKLRRGRSFAELAIRGVRFMRRSDGKPFNRYDSRELARLRSSSLIDGAGPVVTEKGVITKAYDNRLMVFIEADVPPDEFRRYYDSLGLTPAPRDPNQSSYGWQYVDADPHIGEGVSDIVQSLFQNPDVVSVANRVIALVW